MTHQESAVVFQDIFTVLTLNPDGKRFDKVNRIVSRSEEYEANLALDIASEILNLKDGEKFVFALASTLRLDGQPDDGTYDQSGQPSLLESYDYGMSGKVFKYEYSDDNRVSVVASFGGLLMLLQAGASVLNDIDLDQRIYCLIKKNA